MNKRIVYFVLLIVLVLLSAVDADAAISDVFKRHVRLTNSKPLSEQLKWSKTIYVIRDEIDFNGEMVKIPDKSVLHFKGGMLSNGTLTGDYTIKAPSVLVFDNVDISSYEMPVKFSWFVGKRRELYTKDFNRLPTGTIDFEGVDFKAGETLVWDQLKGFEFENLNLSSSFNIHYWLKTVVVFDCSPYGNINSYDGRIELSSTIPSKYQGYLIELATADRTRFDFRPDAEGVPALYKGITSIITKTDGQIIELEDSLEFFSAERLYNKTIVKSKCRIIEPHGFTLKNCHFVFYNKAGISLRGVDFLIEKCSFEACDGANSIVSLGGHNGSVLNCVVRGAFYTGSNTSYGIQIVKGTGITIQNCSFYENRRSVDFSGNYESRYNVVRECYFYQQNNNAMTGSAMGGHSTSYANVFINNDIYGHYQVGIQCRGENEIINGNRFHCSAATMIVFSYNTKIINNTVEADDRYATGVFAGSGIMEEGNSLLVSNNKVDLSKTFINGDCHISYIINNNDVRFMPYASSIKPVLFSQPPLDYHMSNNIIRITRKAVDVRLNENGAVIESRIDL